LAKTKISSTELSWIFQEKLSAFNDFPASISIAIVPSEGGWTAVMSPRIRKSFPDCIRRIEKIQKQLRQAYILAND
jgi:hypothetical protein